MSVNKELIILNRMFTGRYLNDIDNIGHEIINLFKADDENHYVYLCADGSYNASQLPQYTIQVRSHSTRTLEIVNIAEIEGKVSETEIEKISYGDVGIVGVFAQNKEQRAETYVTFKARRVIKPRPGRHVYIAYEGNRSKKADFDNAYVSDDAFVLNEKVLVKGKGGEMVEKYNFDVSESLRNYIENRNPENKNSDYAKLHTIIVNAFEEADRDGEDRIWVDVEDIIPKDEGQKADNKGITPAEIYGIGNLELPFSNAFSFFLKRYPELLLGFCTYLKDVVGMGGERLKELCDYLSAEPMPQLVVKREWNNIDILIEVGDEWVIVVENKIFSDLNGKDRDDKTQLDKYHKIICDCKLDGGKQKNIYYGRNKLFVLLTPNHNDISLDSNSEWKKLFYRPLANYMLMVVEDDRYKGDLHLHDFTTMVERHSHDDYNLGEMTRRFKRILNKLK